MAVYQDRVAPAALLRAALLEMKRFRMCMVQTVHDYHHCERANCENEVSVCCTKLPLSSFYCLYVRTSVYISGPVLLPRTCLEFPIQFAAFALRGLLTHHLVVAVGTRVVLMPARVLPKDFDRRCYFIINLNKRDILLLTAGRHVMK